MKVTLDLDKLLNEQQITQEDYDKLVRLGARGTAALAFNILVGFGVVSVGAASLALVPTPITAITLGAIVCAAGIGLLMARRDQWRVLANICVVLGALMFGGGTVAVWEGSVASFLVVATAFAAAGVLARSQLLIVLAVLALSSCLGARTGYFHATYFLGIEEPALTVVLFALFSAGMYRLSKVVPVPYQGLAIAASRTGVFLVNFGFWIGSLWGDRTGDGQVVVDGWVFSLLWAIVLIAAGAWAWRRNRRWLLNIIAVFGAIHIYTQWFEHLGASPETLLVAGLLALGFAVGMRALNQQMEQRQRGPAASAPPAR